MREIEIFFPSHDGSSEIRALLWEDDSLSDDSETVREGSLGNARCILQLLHGMAEHIERYRNFAEYGTKQGYIVCGHDHIGHGKSVKDPGQWGHMPMNGREVLIQDTHHLRLLMQERYQPESGAQLPIVMVGHSMGSFVLRDYLARYGEGVAAAVISGTGQQPPLLSAVGKFLARVIGANRGIEHRSKLLYNLSIGAYSKQVDNPRTPLDWLSTEESIVDDYIAAPDCGFHFDCGGNYSLTQLTGSMVKRETVAAVPLALPLLFIAGKDDPVGEKGVAVKRAVQLFQDTGHTDVTLILYNGMRHEVLNEKDRARVYNDVSLWLEKRIQLLTSS